LIFKHIKKIWVSLSPELLVVIVQYTKKIKVVDICCFEVQTVEDLTKRFWGVYTSVGKGLHVVAVRVFVCRLSEIDHLMLAGGTILHQCCVYLDTMS
jgi:hypothetical protein